MMGVRSIFAGGLVIGVAVLLAIVRLGGVHIPLPFVSGQPEPPPLSLLPDWAGTDRVNILVLGIDQREDERAQGVPTRSDVVMVASLNPVDKTAALIAFPRDLWVSIPGFGERRINDAYQVGEVAHVVGGGPAVAAQTIETNFGLATQYYVVVDFPAVEQLVDGVGGVVLDVPHPIKDNEFPTPDYGTERLYLLPGPQLMNGATALKYARSRHSDSDAARMQRQQQIVLALQDRVLRLDLLPQLPSLIERRLWAVQTNLQPSEVLALAKLGSQIGRKSLSNLVIEGDLVETYGGEGSAALLLPKTAEIQRAIERVLNSSKAPTD